MIQATSILTLGNVSAYIAILIAVCALVSTGITYFLRRRENTGTTETSDADILWDQAQKMRTELQDQLDAVTAQRDKLIEFQYSQVLPALGGISEQLVEITEALARLEGRDESAWKGGPEGNEGGSSKDLGRTMLKRKHAYWWRGAPNFGDQLAPLLLERFAGIKAVWEPVSRADIVTVGSILEHIPPLWDGWILGSGKLYEDSRLHLHTNTSTILALRGPLSARQCPHGDYAIGDPGLLAPDLLDEPEPEKLYDLGILPHWSDRHLVTDERFFNKAWFTQVISPTQDPMTVIREVSKCQKIVTSSLHGMILADAFGIPRRFELAKNWDQYQGGTFKFRDYLASIGAPFIVGKQTSVSRLRIEDRKYELYDAYEELGRLVRRR